MKTAVRTLCGLLILWLVVELVLCLFGIWGRFGPTVIDPVMLVVGLTLVVALAAMSIRDSDRTVEERQVVVRLVTASSLTVVATILSWGEAGEFGVAKLAVVFVIPAIVVTFMAVVSYVRYVRGEPVSGPSIAWRVAGSILVLLVGLCVTLVAGALAGLAGFSCSGGVIGEGCGGGSWLAAVVVWAMLGPLAVWAAWSAAASGDRPRAPQEQSVERSSPPPMPK